MAETAGRYALLRYLLLQLPGGALAGLVLVGLWSWMGVPGWAALVAMLVWVAKDIAMYPLVRRSFSLGESEWVGVRRLIGARGLAIDDIAPAGWVRVKGELWRAEALGDGPPIPRGTTIRVRHVRGLTLFIERESALEQAPTRSPRPAVR